MFKLIVFSLPIKVVMSEFVMFATFIRNLECMWVSFVANLDSTAKYKNIGCVAIQKCSYAKKENSE